MGSTKNPVRDGARHVSLLVEARECNRTASAFAVLRTGLRGDADAAEERLAFTGER